VSNNTSAAELRQVALNQFASVGFAGTSLAQIAEAAGLSKSSVLYHYASKEALLEAAIGPAVDRIEQLVDRVPALDAPAGERNGFVEDFIDFLLERRLEVHTFINQGQSLRGVPVIDRANAAAERLGRTVTNDLPTVADQVRFGVALGGAAYILAAGLNWGDDDVPEAELRAALIDVVSQLLAAGATPAAPTDPPTR
jgi:AcrR family transcriptional regulator